MGNVTQFPRRNCVGRSGKGRRLVWNSPGPLFVSALPSTAKPLCELFSHSFSCLFASRMLKVSRLQYLRKYDVTKCDISLMVFLEVLSLLCIASRPALENFTFEDLRKRIKIEIICFRGWFQSSSCTKATLLMD